jgi:hypothetical protein
MLMAKASFYINGYTGQNTDYNPHYKYVLEMDSVYLIK